MENSHESQILIMTLWYRTGDGKVIQSTILGMESDKIKCTCFLWYLMKIQAAGAKLRPWQWIVKQRVRRYQAIVTYFSAVMFGQLKATPVIRDTGYLVERDIFRCGLWAPHQKEFLSRHLHVITGNGWQNVRPRRRWEETIRMDLREIVWEGVDWIHLAQDMDQWEDLVRTLLKLRVP